MGYDCALDGGSHIGQEVLILIRYAYNNTFQQIWQIYN